MIQSALQGILEYFNLLFQAMGYALRLDPLVYERAITHPRSVEIIAGIVFLAGMSMLLGQSVILFVNKVRRGRFISPRTDRRPRRPCPERTRWSGSICRTTAECSAFGPDPTAAGKWTASKIS